MPSTEVIAAISAVLTLSALGFSIFASIYSNLLHTAEMADGNALQGNEISKRYWRKASCEFRKLAWSRAYSANFCFWGLVVSIATLILFLREKNLCLVIVTLLIVVVVLLCIALSFGWWGLKCLKNDKLGAKKKDKRSKCLTLLQHIFCHILKKDKCSKCLTILQHVFCYIFWHIIWPVHPDVKKLTIDC